jgi:bifunctional DNA-binding transcriptional regulator/antitoxin component of YhaV-PrlF toxin-antitoxin module
LSETTYHRDKVYLPRDIQEKLGLKEGDRIHIEVVGSGEARLSVIRSAQASIRLLEKLENPPDLGKVGGEFSRMEIYENLTGY